MNHHDDLLEPFPAKKRRADNETSLLTLFQRRLNRSNNSIFGKSSSSNLASSAASLAHTGCSTSTSEAGGDDSDENFDIDVSSSSFNLISVASIVGDGDEFKRLQEDLRKSRMLTGLGTQQILKEYIESGGRQVEAKRQSDPELSKVKRFAPAQPQRRRRGIGDRLSQSVHNLCGSPAGHDIQHGSSDGLSQNIRRFEASKRNNDPELSKVKRFAPAQPQRRKRGIGDRLSQSVHILCGSPAGHDIQHGSSDGLSQNIRNFGARARPAASDLEKQRLQYRLIQSFNLNRGRRPSL